MRDGDETSHEVKAITCAEFDSNHTLGIAVPISAGALGASLTGAGIAGTVLALCHADDVDRISQAVCDRMTRADYAGLANRTAPLSEAEIAQTVVVNAATAKAGELALT